MSQRQLSFLIPVKQRLPELVHLLQNEFTVRVQPESIAYRVFYDTFDWRLYKAGASLEVQQDERSSRIYWRPDMDSRSSLQLAIDKVPQLATDLPESDFRQQLKSVISVRELIPRIEVRIKRQPVVVVNSNEKVVVRIQLDEYWFSTSRRRGGKELGKQLTIKLVKGYQDNYQQVLSFIQGMNLSPARDNIMKLAIIAKGIDTGEYTSRLNLLLDPDETAEQAFRKILLRLLEIMQQNTAGCINGRDIEYMHDYRVAIRKIRSVLKDANDFFPLFTGMKYKEFFAMLGNLTTPVRDMDVFLLKLDHYQELLTEEERLQLQPVREYLESCRAKAQKKLVKMLKSAHYRKSIKQWQDFLNGDKKSDAGVKIPRADIKAGKLADKLIWGLYQKTEKRGAAITQQSTADDLHKLRKTFKRLRYMIDFFRSLYPAKNLRDLLEVLTLMQDNLGNYNDLEVHIGIIRQFIDQSNDESAVSACRHLIAILNEQKHEIRAGFAQCYANFSSVESQGIFRELFVDYHQRSH